MIIEEEAREMVRTLLHEELERRPKVRAQYNRVAEYHAMIHMAVGVMVETVLAMDRVGVGDKIQRVMRDTWTVLLDREGRVDELRQHYDTTDLTGVIEGAEVER